MLTAMTALILFMAGMTLCAYMLSRPGQEESDAGERLAGLFYALMMIVFALASTVVVIRIVGIVIGAT